jgi:hypothetical protein
VAKAANVSDLDYWQPGTYGFPLNLPHPSRQ